MNCKELTSYRKVGIEGVNELLWVTEDVGAFGRKDDGPLGDWISCKDDFMKHVKKFDVVVQAGGNCGMYPRFYKNYFKEVYTFEPDELNYYCLDNNCQGEGYHKFFGGVGCTTDKLSLHRNRMDNVGMHKIQDRPGDVQMHIIDELNLTDCDLIHLDVEGYEEKALKGAINTIQKYSPVIITERSGGQSFLESLGYTVYKKFRMDTIYIKV